MSDKINTIHKRADLVQQFNGWDGAPPRDPDYITRVYWIDPYWYVTTTDGEHQVMSQDQVITDEDLIWCVGEHVRILRLPQYRKPDEA